MAYDIEGARKAGLSDDQIAEYLAKKHGFDAAGAMDAGYSSGEMVDHLMSEYEKTPSTKHPSAVKTGTTKEDLYQQELKNMEEAHKKGRANLAGLAMGAVHDPARGAAKLINKVLPDGVKAGIDSADQWLRDNSDTYRKFDDAVKSAEKNYAGLRKDAGYEEDGFDPHRTAGQIIATAPVGGVLGGVVTKLAPYVGKAAPFVEGLANAIKSGGMRTGANPSGFWAGAGDAAVRSAGGAANGWATAALLTGDTHEARKGALISAVFPQVVRGTGNSAAWLGRKVRGAAEPLFPTNDAKILDSFLRSHLGDMYDTAKNNIAQYVKSGSPIKGYKAATAEVARVPSLSGLHRTVTSVDPVAINAYAGGVLPKNREVIRATIEDLAGRDGAADFARSMRDSVADMQYRDAFEKPIDMQRVTPWVKGRITSLTKSPHVQEAIEAAKKLAKTEGINTSDSAMGSIRGMHYVKKELDSMIESARNPNEARIIGLARDRLVGVMNKLSDDYANAMREYASNSVPVNRFERLEGLAAGALNPKGETTLMAFNRALNKMNKVKTPYKVSLGPEQEATIKALQDVLEGADFALTAGKGVGSDTVQKLAASSSFPGTTVARTVSRIPGVNLLSGVVGRGVDGLYGAANSRLAHKLGEAVVDPEHMLKIMQEGGAAAQKQQVRLMQEFLNSSGAARAMRTLPALTADQR